MPTGSLLWFLAQYVRFGYLKAEPNYAAIAEKLTLDDLYTEVAKEMGVPAQTDMQPIKTSYDVLFNPKDIDTYLKTAKK
jgi:nitrate/nitrite transport system substrate-binding protein